MSFNERDVIAAIASAHGQGAIGVIRLSGDGVLGVIEKVFRPRASFESHRMYYGKIFSASHEVIDEVMLCYMQSPRSFTCENSVEIYAHGGVFVLGEVLRAVLENGARLAEPGEFTKRAFLNGRLNLSQAEAVMDLIGAKSGAARRAALRQLGGGLSVRIEKLRDKILTWLAHIELSIDYPEHEDEARNASEILSEGGEVIASLKKLAETASIGRVIREGVRTAIIGRPNVGKSTLLNAILHENRAIVHETAGTTRDVLTEQVRMGDVPLVIMDTAGLRETSDPIEKIGIEKTHESAADAELILYVVDSTQGFAEEDREILERYGGREVIVLMNKSDLGALPLFPDCSVVGMSPRSLDGVPKCGNGALPLPSDHISISAKTGDGLERLYALIHQKFLSGCGTGGETDIITRERHRILLAQTLTHVENAMRQLGDGVPEDLVSISLRSAYLALGEILGVEIGDDIVDRIFEEFCLGK
ncbi:MAG: tRNA uridine-5-carboxymethylaminomethyl(34) synthesis GTPase MnmE [Defluviitaleaceae bacterium]|nr:tRNA uridine-5-carboxymethylaminomethyl(34) synthesis GTPase MnmE [Defluviitaleaceae bacterium]